MLAFHAQVREVGQQAPWRHQQLSHSDCIERILKKGKPLNPLPEAPFVTDKIFRMDWLHNADQGVCPDFIGNFFHEILHMFPGSTTEDRCHPLYEEIEAYYEANEVADRFDTMLLTFFAAPDKNYKLKGSAAKCRALVPFAWHLAQELLDPTNPKQDALLKAAFHLNEVYTALLSNHPSPKSHMKEHGF